MKKYLTLVIALAALLAGGLTAGLAAREEPDEKAEVSRCGCACTRCCSSAMAKAHPDQSRAMLAAAKKALEATTASYDVHTVTLERLHYWSRQVLLCERALADTKEEDLAALLGYWKRSKHIYNKIRALYNTGTKGGETEKFGAVSFYLAEAELWLAAAGGEVPENLD